MYQFVLPILPMIKKIIILLFLFPAICFADGGPIQVHYNGPITAAASGNNFTHFSGSTGTSTTENIRQSISPTSGTIKRLYVQVSAAPDNGAGTDTLTFAARVAGASTAATCTISEAETSCQWDGSVAYSAGGLMAVIQTAANTPATPTWEAWWWTVDDTYGESMHLVSSSGTNLGTAAANYLTPTPGGINTTESSSAMPMPFAGTIEGSYCALSGDPANGAGVQSYTFAVVIGGSPSSNTFVIEEGTTTDNDTTNKPTFTAGQTITMSSTPANTPTARTAKCGIVVSNTVGGFAILGKRDANMGVASAEYRQLTGFAAWNATETVVDQVSSQVQFKAYYNFLNGAPDNGANTQSYTFVVRDDVAGTGCTCAVSEAETTCNDTCGDLVSAGSMVGNEQTPANTPTARISAQGIWALVRHRGYTTN